MEPLEGVRILAVEHVGAAPYGTMFLASLGADVLRIEHGDPARRTGPHLFGDNDSQYFQTFSLNKRAIWLDLKREREKFHGLVKEADAVINNLRGDQPAKLGIDYASLAPVNPAIVCAHLSAYGRDNERSTWPGYDFLMQAECGLMSLTGEPSGPPARYGTSIIDCMSGMTAAAGLLACLLKAKKTGKGCDVDTSLYEVALHQLNYAGTWYLNEGDVSTRQPRGAHLSLTPVQTFPTADGWIFIMCMADHFWTALADELGLAPDERFNTARGRLQHRAALTELLDAAFRRHPTSHWLKTMRGKVPIAPVNDVAQALENPFVKSIGMVQEAPHPARPDFRVLATPVKVNGKRPKPKVCK